jgi:hypothetical protein
MGLSTEQSIALLGGAVAANANGGTTSPPTAEAALADEGSKPAETRDFGAHLLAIEKLLSPEEMALARRAVLQMSPEVLKDWRERLLRLSPGAAAALIRAEIHGGAK